MQLLRHVARPSSRFASPVVAVSYFEGVHLGHRLLLRQTVEIAASSGVTPLALICLPAPRRNAATNESLRVDSLRQRIQQIAALGVDTIALARCFAASSAETLGVVLGQQLQPKRVVVIPEVSPEASDVAGDPLIQSLAAIGARCGFAVETISPPRIAAVPVTSVRLRQAILDGDLPGASAMLGRDPAVTGRVRRGFQRGRSIGFPTANLRLGGVALPPNGVYAVQIVFDGRLYGGVANLGVSPTFGDNQRTLESYIFDFNDDLYGKRIEVRFLKGLRAERKFPGIDALVQQIQLDAEQARAILALR